MMPLGAKNANKSAAHPVIAVRAVLEILMYISTFRFLCSGLSTLTGARYFSTLFD
jgi:hypothetical protein